ncbi:MAG: hypothetical protein V1833_02835 [Elusimicrobiota bacterium]
MEYIFDLDRMKVYMALPAEAKLKHLQEANDFFSKFRNKRVDKIRKELKQRGF